MVSIKKIEEAKELLKKSGYYVDHLWHVDDVQQRCYCTEKQAQEVLDMALSDDWIKDQLYDSINTAIDTLKLPEEAIMVIDISYL